MLTSQGSKLLNPAFFERPLKAENKMQIIYMHRHITLFSHVLSGPELKSPSSIIYLAA